MKIITKRQKDILSYFMDQKEPVTVDKLAYVFSVSKRTIQYEIQNINNVLSANDLKAVIKAQRNKGLMLDTPETEKEKIKKRISALDTRYLSQPERVIQIETLLLLNMADSLNDIAEQCQVSKKTILNDLETVKADFQRYGISLRNVVLSGKEKNIREMFESILDKTGDEYIYLNELINKAIDEKYIKTAKEIVYRISSDLQQRYILTGAFIYNLAFCLFRAETGNHIEDGHEDLIHENQESVKIYRILCDELDEKEAAYITKLFLSTKVYSSEAEDRNVCSTEKEIAEYLINELNTLIGKRNSDKSFRHHLELHLKVAIYRMRNNIRIENTMLKEIKISIPLIYEFTKEKLKDCENKYDLEFDENEIAYLAMHIAAAYEMNIQLDLNMDVLIVCSFGLATSSMLKSRISQLMVDCNFIDSVSEKEAYEYLADHDVDLIISTHDFHADGIPSIKVNPILTLQDTIDIREQLLIISYKKSCSLFINAYREQYRGDQQISLKDLVQEEDIQIVDSVGDWKEAIQIASKPLLADGRIEQKYIDRMIQAVMDLGNYMILAEETAFIHAGTNDGINQSCIGVTILKQPVLFGESHPENVRNIVVLGMRSKDDVSILRIINFFGTEENLKILKSRKISLEMIQNLKY